MELHRNSLINQDIASKAPKSLHCSSIAYSLDLGSNHETTSQMGEEEKYSTAKWYYMFLRNREMRRYMDIFTGKSEFMLPQQDDKAPKVAKRYQFKVFPYTSTEHKRRLEQCPYSKDAYKEHLDATQAVKEAFTTNDIDKFNAITVADIRGDGYLFVCAPLHQLQEILVNMQPRHYLAIRYKTSEPATISDTEMPEFIYLYESMPYNIELMAHPLEEYVKTKQKIRITGGVFRGKEGYIMRLHRNSHLVLTFGNMTIAISYLHAFPYEKVD